MRCPKCDLLLRLLIWDRKQAQISDKKSQKRLDGLEATLNDQKSMLQILRSQLNDIRTQTTAINVSASKSFKALRFDRVRALGKEIESLMSKILYTNIAFYRVIVPERSLHQDPFPVYQVDDVWGRIAPPRAHAMRLLMGKF